MLVFVLFALCVCLFKFQCSLWVLLRIRILSCCSSTPLRSSLQSSQLLLSSVGWVFRSTYPRSVLSLETCSYHDALSSVSIRASPHLSFPICQSVPQIVHWYSYQSVLCICFSLLSCSCIVHSLFRIRILDTGNRFLAHLCKRHSLPYCTSFC